MGPWASGRDGLKIEVEVITVTVKSDVRPARATRRRAGTYVGGFFVFTGGAHAGIVFADAEAYRHFADDALLGLVSTGWAEVFMAPPAFWGSVAGSEPLRARTFTL